MRIDDLNLSVRTYNTLLRAGINTVEKIREMTDEDLKSVKNLSENAIRKLNRLYTVQIAREVFTESIRIVMLILKTTGNMFLQEINVDVRWSNLGFSGGRLWRKYSMPAVVVGCFGLIGRSWCCENAKWNGRSKE